jgi:hypothetical protein
MVLGLVAISGILAAEAAAAPRAQTVAAVELSYLTHAGEGAAGQKRFGRDGCYQVESGGSTGGAAYARDSQAGCHLPGDVAAVFAKLAAIPGDALAPEKPAQGSATGGARRRGMPGDSETEVVLIRTDGSRWVGANKSTADDILRAVNELPSENQWYAKPPDKSVGTGAQLLVVSAWTAGTRRTEAVLTADGRWWCHLSKIGPRGGEQKLPAKPVKPLTSANAVARMGRILEGVRPPGPDDKNARSSAEPETLTEVAWPDKKRTPLPQVPGQDVAVRFGAEMQAQAPACAVKTSKSR